MKKVGIKLLAILLTFTSIQVNTVNIFANQESDIEKAKEKLDEAQKAYDTAISAETNSAYGFYSSLVGSNADAQTAVNTLDHFLDESVYTSNGGKETGKTVLGGEGDATSFENMLRAVEGLEICNEDYRVGDAGLEEYKVSLSLMALAEVESNMESVTYNHWYWSYGVSCAENAAWGYKLDGSASNRDAISPYSGWYTAEKAIYDAAVAAGNTPDYNKTGHYQNLINTSMTVTGLGYSTKNIKTTVQDFSTAYRVTGTVYTVAEFKGLLTDYISSCESNKTSTLEALNNAKRAYHLAVGHSWDSGTVTKEATCTETGIKTYKCTECGETKTETIDALGHNYSEEWTVDEKPSSIKEGSKSRRCTICGAKGDITTIAKLSFDDVDDSVAHRAEIDWLAENKISTGWTDETTGAKTFRPLETVTRCDMAAFIRRLAKQMGYKDAETYTITEADWNTFTDVVKGNGNDIKQTDHAEDILWLAHAGISEGWTETDGTKTFRPYDTVARADMAAFLRRLAKRLGLSDSVTWECSDSDLGTFKDINTGVAHYEDVLWLAHSTVSQGWNETDGTKTFRPENGVARADMAAFIKRSSDLPENDDITLTFIEVKDDSNGGKVIYNLMGGETIQLEVGKTYLFGYYGTAKSMDVSIDLGHDLENVDGLTFDWISGDIGPEESGTITWNIGSSLKVEKAFTKTVTFINGFTIKIIAK